MAQQIMLCWVIFMINSAILIGNGINRAKNNDAWGKMIEKLSNNCGCDAFDDKCHSNFSLEFERIYFSAVNAGKIKSKYDVKKVFASLIPVLELQRLVTSLPIENHITTNYDYYLEKSILSDYSRKTTVPLTSEKKHSLFRKATIGGRYVWHIYGEQQNPASICLGYEHYCSYLVAMHSYLTKPNENISKTPYIRYFMENETTEVSTWMTLFFTHDIYIVGLSLSFTEMDIWWLLNYRAQFFIDNPKYKKPNIYYYFPAINDSDLHDQLVVLNAMSVDLHPMTIHEQDWSKYYRDILLDIERVIYN